MKNPICNHTRVLLVLILAILSSQLPLLTKSYELPENSPEGTLVADLLNDFVHDLSPDQLTNAMFALSGDLKSKPNSYFTIERNTGKIFCSSVSIDREELCQKRDKCTIELEATVSNRVPNYFKIFKLTISIVDTNDNEPVFRGEPFLFLRIPENTLVNSSFQLPSAFDSDIGANDIQSYELIYESDTGSENNHVSDPGLRSIDRPFYLDVKKTRGRLNHDVRLVLGAKLDREVISSYLLYFKASDGGQPTPKTGTLTLNVTVLDVNDNNPVFEEQPYEKTIDEDFPVDGTILRIKASDADEGLNGEIRYRMTDGQTMEMDFFRLDEVTGDLTLIKKLDNSKNDLFTIEVAAEDLGSDPVSVYNRVYIHVRDINNHAPRIMIAPQNEDGQAEVLENEPLKWFVFHLTASDADRGANGNAWCNITKSIPDPNAFVLEYISDNNFKLVTAVDNIDRELVTEYHLTIRCEDFGSPPLASTSVITVKVLDVDDNPPFFEKSLYNVEIEENNSIGQQLIQLRADDLDSGINARFRFSLCDRSLKDAGRLVAVDELSGSVKALVSFDYEIQKEIRFCVQVDNECTNCSTVSHPQAVKTPTTATAEVVVKILDRNDNAPQFTKTSYSFEIPENSPPNTEIGTVRAIDKDTEPFDKFTFRLIGSPESTSHFSIDETSGKILSVGTLDRELEASYKFAVEVVDSENPKLTSTASVEIKISDLNDNSPTFLPQCQNVKLDLGLVETDQVEICRFEATDADEGNNSVVSYSLNRENSYDLFNISSTTGAFSLNTKNLLDVPEDVFVNQSAIFNVTIWARDGGKPPQWTALRTSVEINLTQEFSMSALRERRDGYFAANPIRIVILVVCLTGLLLIMIVAAVLLKNWCQKRKARERALRPRCEVQLKRNSNNENISDDSADETDNLRNVTIVPNNNNAKVVAIHSSRTNFNDDYDDKIKASKLKYNFSDVSNQSPLKSKYSNSGCCPKLFTRNKKKMSRDSVDGKSDIIYKPSNEPPRKPVINFTPVDNLRDSLQAGTPEDAESHSPVFNHSLKRNGACAKAGAWIAPTCYRSDDHTYRPCNSIYCQNGETFSTDGEVKAYPYSQVSTFFDNQNSTLTRGLSDDQKLQQYSPRPGTTFSLDTHRHLDSSQ